MNSTRILIPLAFIAVAMQGVLIYRLVIRPQRPAQIERTRTVETAQSLDISGMPSMGRDDSPVVVVEFGDYQCPFCREHARETLPELVQQYVATDRIEYAFANLPLAGHPLARELAGAATCAGEQGAYWEMHDSLYQLQPTDNDDVLEISTDLGLDRDQFETCRQSDAAASAITRDEALAHELNLMATPSFVFARRGDAGSVIPLTVLVGVGDLSEFADMIEQIERGLQP